MKLLIVVAYPQEVALADVGGINPKYGKKTAITTDPNLSTVIEAARSLGMNVIITYPELIGQVYDGFGRRVPIVVMGCDSSLDSY